MSLRAGESPACRRRGEAATRRPARVHGDHGWRLPGVPDALHLRSPALSQAPGRHAQGGKPDPLAIANRYAAGLPNLIFQSILKSEKSDDRPRCRARDGFPEGNASLRCRPSGRLAATDRAAGSRPDLRAPPRRLGADVGARDRDLRRPQMDDLVAWAWHRAAGLSAPIACLLISLAGHGRADLPRCKTQRPAGDWQCAVARGGGNMARPVPPLRRRAPRSISAAVGRRLDRPLWPDLRPALRYLPATVDLVALARDRGGAGHAGAGRGGVTWRVLGRSLEHRLSRAGSGLRRSAAPRPNRRARVDAGGLRRLRVDPRPGHLGASRRRLRIADGLLLPAGSGPAARAGSSGSPAPGRPRGPRAAVRG